MNGRAINDSALKSTLDHQQANALVANAYLNMNHLVVGSGQPADSDEKPPSPAMSDDSCDSGRDSALAGEMSLLSHSSSFDSCPRPTHLSLCGTVSSSSSSESLLVQSPLHSPPFHATGHISLLPRILESLAVSGNLAHQQRISAVHRPFPTLSSQVQQLAQPPCYADAIQPTRDCLPVAQLPPVKPHDSATLASSFLSPASRKRSNSITNTVDNGKNTSTTVPSSRPIPKQRKVKSNQKIHPNDINASPISGTFIRADSDCSENDVIVIRRGDFDKSLTVVEVTEEAKAGLADIVNKIGPYSCKLCKLTFSDAFDLAGHNCSRIIHIEYQCPECGKSFHCPANLASHRRWHKPRPAATGKQGPAIAAPPAGKTKKASPEPKALTTQQENSRDHLEEEPSFVQKTGNTSVPFKKRFLFRRFNERDSSVGSEAELLPASPVSSTMSSPALSPVGNFFAIKSANSPILLQEFQQYHCQMCNSIIRGAQVFARHWQTCLVATANRSWTSMFCPPKSS